MNITERNIAGKFGTQDKGGITIQQTNVIDENGQNLVIPEGSWLNGFCSSGAFDTVAVGSTIPITIRTKPNPNGGMYYNFGYYPKGAAAAPATAQPAAAPAPAPQPAPTTEYATKAELNEALESLQNQINELSEQVSF